ncbi:hypothetical protein [Amnibacterium sp.]|uniref:hypothetical protein n=1 Tax=Amnibacterium sp. TaxID=1872496 RepID=UPI00261749F0|nr:hypothetical protein [Amnibacterium sp.]
MRWFRNDIDTTLTEFFATRRRGCAGRRLASVRVVEQLLRDCVETVADEVLAPDERTVLAAEREFRPEGAAARVAQPGLLIAVLPRYLSDDRWRPSQPEERRAQVLAAGALVRHLVGVLPPGQHAAGFRAAAAAIDDAALRIRSDSWSVR